MKVTTIKSTEIGDIACFDPDSTKYILNEIIDDKVYEKDFFSFHEDDTIVDVGANIGIFALYVAKKVHNKAHLYCIEPVPNNYEVLSRNVKALSPSMHAKLYNLGMGDFETPEEVEFTYFPNSSVLSTMDKTIIEEGFLAKQSVETAKIFYKAIRSRISPLKYHFNMFFLSLKPFSEYLYKSIIKNISKEEKIKCRMSNLSRFIKENQINKIDFLKIDTEGAEMKILHGLKEEDWDIIKQTAIEVHHESYINPIVAMLKDHNFTHIEVQKDDYMNTEIGEFHQIFAS